jgi:hypothetical protein
VRLASEPVIIFAAVGVKIGWILLEHLQRQYQFVECLLSLLENILAKDSRKGSGTRALL